MTDPNNLIERDLAVLWHPCAQMTDYQQFPPLPVVGASGLDIELADGRRLLDGISSWWCKSLGHGHPHLLQALRDQAAAFEHVILANTTNPGVVRLCERLLAVADGQGPEAWGPDAPLGKPDGFYSRVFFGDGGSTAVEIALKMALQAQRQMGRPERTGFVALERGYHGETVATLAVGDCGLYGDPYRPLFFEVPKLTGLPDRLSPEDDDWLDVSAEWPGIQAQLEQHAATMAAVVVEPVLQGAGGMCIVSPALLARLRAWCDANDVFLIADEIAAGFGRCGPMLASHLADLTDVRAGLPHFAVISKGLTGGVLPMSAVLTTETIYESFLGGYFSHKAFLHSNTWTGNALAVAVANASLDVYASEGVLDNVAQVGPRLREGLRRLAAGDPRLQAVRGVGMVAAVDLHAGDGSPLDSQARTGLAVYRACIERGALLRNLGDTMYLFPPLITSSAQADQLLAILAEAIDAVIPR